MILSRKNMLDAALTLPPQERADLVKEIWDSLADDAQELKLTAAQEQELERCWQAYLADPKAGSAWPGVRGRVLARQG
jgi:putative addiction module component (TIGR02574 family)